MVLEQTCGVIFITVGLASASARKIYCTAANSSQFTAQQKRTWRNSDPAMKQFLLYLDESNALGKKFIIQDIDDTHIFVIAELVNVLQERVGELMDQNAFSLTQK
ncbi:general transcription factor IIH subunit 5 isoform X1 [Balaenoptera acutorostrata]|uniref:General transcription and DNA repair factor IIH subunit TFB5 n=1 Tax=Balaenoptera acutorostrata TaxID=9767 RepID=A0ABM3S337_BALAC|nr:general transcription factor IIH subunit 5 isoform X1 [Balaenoptera acutorostrata]